MRVYIYYMTGNGDFMVFLNEEKSINTVLYELASDSSKLVLWTSILSARRVKM